MADTTEPQWVTVTEAARRLGMSASWFKQVAAEEGIVLHRRGRAPGVWWPDVEAFIERSRIARVTHSLLRQVHDPAEVRGVEQLDQVRTKFGWSDHDIADALGVTSGSVSHWRVDGVPGPRMIALEELAALSPESVPKARAATWREARRGVS